MAENARVVHEASTGRGWRQRAGRLIVARLDEIFPGHGIGAGDLVGDLAIGQRQLVEIARAFTVTDMPARLVILDEPTCRWTRSWPTSSWPSCAGSWPAAGRAC